MVVRRCKWCVLGGYAFNYIIDVVGTFGDVLDELFEKVVLSYWGLLCNIC